MDAFLCRACGTEFAPAETPPEACPICRDERQFVPATGQDWTTLAALQARHKTVVHLEAGVLGFGCTPDFAIGQRALLIRTPAGNVLWDCISLVDAAAIEMIGALGGLQAIAISHPHYYTTMLRWSDAFGGVPVHLHADDRQWAMRDGLALNFWEGERLEILPGLTLVRCGGHFDGATVLHSAQAKGGALFSGDVLQVTPDGSLGFMRSFPNYIPLGAAAVRRIETALDGLAFEAVYGAFWGRVIETGRRAALRRSVERHVDWVGRE